MPRIRNSGLTILGLLGLLLLTPMGHAADPDTKSAARAHFQTSDRCVVCHNGMVNAAGDEYSIGLDWRVSLMANSSRDPYWQASLRRETLDHPSAQAAIEDECSACHMAIPHYEATQRGQPTDVLAHLPLTAHASRIHEDGVTCTVCHQITPERLGTPASYNGNFVIGGTRADGSHPEFGPYDIDQGLQQLMRTSTEGYQPQYGAQIQTPELCASCHTLITTARDAQGKEMGSLPEQMVYQEWQHSDFRAQRTCQSCHMPEVPAQIAVSRILAAPRPNAKRHFFVGANFVMQKILGRWHDELDVVAEPGELYAAAERTSHFLQSQAAALTLAPLRLEGARLIADVTVENLGGHKLPTAYPARRTWLHVAVHDRNGRLLFESGALKDDGSIVGNDNDADPSRFEPHYREIRSPDQVQIYEAILADPQGHPTTGLITATQYLKDNRLLPRGFDKRSAAPDIAVHGDALADPGFDDRGHRIRYSIDVEAAEGPLVVAVELWYQPIGYRWARNLATYDAEETRRFGGYFDSLGRGSAVVLAAASGATH